VNHANRLAGPFVGGVRHVEAADVGSRRHQFPE